MIYGKRFLPKEDSSSFIDVCAENVCYMEYIERKSILEACADEPERKLIEAQVDVLYEVSIKDIIHNLKELYYKFKDWLSKVLIDLVDKIIKNKKNDPEVEKKKNEIKRFFKNMAHDPVRDWTELIDDIEKLKEHDWYVYTMKVTSGDKVIKETAFDGKNVKKDVEDIFMPYMRNFTDYQMHVLKDKEGYKDDEADKMNQELAAMNFKAEKFKYDNILHLDKLDPNKFINALDEALDCSDNYDEATKYVDETVKTIKKMDSEINDMVKKLPDEKMSNTTDIIVYNGNNVSIRDYGGALRFEIMYLRNIADKFKTMGSCLVHLRNANVLQHNQFVYMMNAINNKLESNHKADGEYKMDGSDKAFQDYKEKGRYSRYNFA